jgi:uncharacterized protein (DUF983 family)
MRMVRRAMLLRCPHCASRRTFVRRWLGRHDRCRTCGIEWRREDGFELGAITVNIIATFIVLTVAMTVGFIVTAPDIPVLPLVLGLSAIAVGMPLAIFPFTNLMWLAVDLAAHPPEADELATAAAAVVAGGAAAVVAGGAAGGAADGAADGAVDAVPSLDLPEDA